MRFSFEIETHASSGWRGGSWTASGRWRRGPCGAGRRPAGRSGRRRCAGGRPAPTSPTPAPTAATPPQPPPTPARWRRRSWRRCCCWRRCSAASGVGRAFPWRSSATADEKLGQKSGRHCKTSTIHFGTNRVAGNNCWILFSREDFVSVADSFSSVNIGWPQEKNRKKNEINLFSWLANDGSRRLVSLINCNALLKGAVAAQLCLPPKKNHDEYVPNAQRAKKRKENTTTTAWFIFGTIHHGGNRAGRWRSRR